MSIRNDPLWVARRDDFGDEDFQTIIDAMAPIDGPLDPVSGDWGIETNDSAFLAEDKLDSLLVSRLMDGRWFETRPIGGCEQTFAREVDLPFYDNPESLNDTVAWADVCVTPRSWLQMSVLGFGADPIEALLTGISPASVDRVREGLREGPDVVPMGFVELDKNGRFTDLQEGRNRGVAALLEGIAWMQGRVFLNWDKGRRR